MTQWSYCGHNPSAPNPDDCGPALSSSGWPWGTTDTGRKKSRHGIILKQFVNSTLKYRVSSFSQTQPFRTKSKIGNCKKEVMYSFKEIFYTNHFIKKCFITFAYTNKVAKVLCFYFLRIPTMESSLVYYWLSSTKIFTRDCTVIRSDTYCKLRS